MDLIRFIRDKMTKDRLMFVYRGAVTSDNSIPLLMLLEREMEYAEFGFLGRKRLFMFVLESLQNVSRHSKNTMFADKSLVVFAKTDNGYTVTTVNVLPTSNIDNLRLKLDEINMLGSDEIRAIYRQMLSTAEFSNKGGAGLGLLEMAKKTGNRLDYDFIPLNDEYSYFILSKTVDPGGVGSNTRGEVTPFSGSGVMQIEKIMAENNIYLIWSGHISPDVGKEVLFFTETKLIEDEIESGLRKRVFGILVEILENVARYSAERAHEKEFGMPVAIIRYDDGVYSLTTGNLLPAENADRLREKLELINSYNREGLAELLKESLRMEASGSGSTGNLGLIDIAMKSSDKLVFSFENINDLFSYYTLTVKVEEKNIQ
jgi:hypothetical protein